MLIQWTLGSDLKTKWVTKNKCRDHRIMEFWFWRVKSPDQGVVFRWVRSPDHGNLVSEITGSWNFREWDHRITGFGEVDHEIVRIKTTRSWKIRDHNHGIIYFDDPAEMDHKIMKKLWSYDLGPWSMGLKPWHYLVLKKKHFAFSMPSIFENQATFFL